MEGIETLAAMFAEATGLNPEPLLVGIDSMNSKLHAAIYELQSTKGTPKPQPNVVSSDLEPKLRLCEERIAELEKILKEE